MVLLAIAALDPAAWAPARIWILAYVVTRSAFAAWAASMRATFVTGRIPEMRGWALRAPVLAVAFGVIVVAGHRPARASRRSRPAGHSSTSRSAVRSQVLVFLGTFAPLAYYGRLLAIGLVRPERRRRRAGWRG